MHIVPLAACPSCRPCKCDPRSCASTYSASTCTLCLPALALVQEAGFVEVAGHRLEASDIKVWHTVQALGPQPHSAYIPKILAVVIQQRSV